MLMIENLAATLAVSRLDVEARVSAQKFYEVCGFVCKEEEYLRYYIPHQRMSKVFPEKGFCETRRSRGPGAHVAATFLVETITR